MTTLPPEIGDLAELEPYEDLFLAILRENLPDSIPVQSLYSDDQTFPVVLVRRAPDWGFWDGQEPWLDMASVEIHVLCQGIEADKDCAVLSNAIRAILRRSVNKVYPGLGHIKSCYVLQAPHRTPDWATSSGPVQYADLPTGVMRYETMYRCAIRPPRP